MSVKSTGKKLSFFIAKMCNGNKVVCYKIFIWLNDGLIPNNFRHSTHLSGISKQKLNKSSEWHSTDKPTHILSVPVNGHINPMLFIVDSLCAYNFSFYIMNIFYEQYRKSIIASVPFRLLKSTKLQQMQMNSHEITIVIVVSFFLKFRNLNYWRIFFTDDKVTN